MYVPVCLHIQIEYGKEKNLYGDIFYAVVVRQFYKYEILDLQALRKNRKVVPEIGDLSLPGSKCY